MQVSKIPVGLSARGAAPVARGDAANAAGSKETHSVIHNAVEVFISNKARAMNQEADRQRPAPNWNCRIWMIKRILCGIPKHD